MSLYRPMVAEDLPAVALIEQAAHAFPWSESLIADSLREGHWCQVMEHEGRIVAYLIVLRILDEAHLLNITVDPACQRQGWGRRLLQAACAELVQLGMNVLFLEVRVSNAPALALYTALGCEQVGLRRRYYPAASGREDAVVMRLELSEPA